MSDIDLKTLTPDTNIPTTGYLFGADNQTTNTPSVYPVTVVADAVVEIIGNLVGPTGPTGPTGVAGPTGSSGVAGATGPTGPSGTSGTNGPTGPTGAAGTGITYKGTVATVGNLPSSGNAVGDAYVVTADDHLYVWNGSAWTDAGPVAASITGPTGATGATGGVGPTGPTGVTGAGGPTGPTGANSTVAGPTGPTGAPGTSVGLTTFLDGATATGPQAYNLLVVPNTGTQTTLTRTTNSTSGVLLGSFVTPAGVPNNTSFVGGLWTLHAWISHQAGGNTFRFWTEVQEVASNGTTVLQTLATGDYASGTPVTSATASILECDLFVPSSTLASTSSRILVNVYVQAQSGTPDAILYMRGNTQSHVVTTIAYNVAGPTGPTGAASTVAGPTGPTGDTGPAGPTGPTGANSTVAGPTGATGPTGPSATGSVINTQTFDSSGTWTKPSGYSASSRVLVQAWGAGGSGGRDTTATRASGGGGGGYIERWLNLSQLGATETITIGAGGAARTGTNQTGAVGGNTTVGSLVTAYGGGGGGGLNAVTNVNGGGGGGQLSAGETGTTTTAATFPGRPYICVADTDSSGSSPYLQGGGVTTSVPSASMAAFWHGGGGGNATTTAANNAGAQSGYGGGGGGGNTTGTGGTSLFGGNGGAAGATGTAGTQPGGGGGAATGTSGAGGAGRAIITVFPA